MDKRASPPPDSNENKAARAPSAWDSDKAWLIQRGRELRTKVAKGRLLQRGRELLDFAAKAAAVAWCQLGVLSTKLAETTPAQRYKLGPNKIRIGLAATAGILAVWIILPSSGSRQTTTQQAAQQAAAQQEAAAQKAGAIQQTAARAAEQAAAQQAAAVKQAAEQQASARQPAAQQAPARQSAPRQSARAPTTEESQAIAALSYRVLQAGDVTACHSQAFDGAGM